MDVPGRVFIVWLGNLRAPCTWALTVVNCCVAELIDVTAFPSNIKFILDAVRTVIVSDTPDRYLSLAIISSPLDPSRTIRVPIDSAVSRAV